MPTVALPINSVGRQMAWVIATMNGPKLPSDAELIARFAPAFLAAIPPDQIRSVFTQLASTKPYRVTAISVHEAAALAVEVVDSAGSKVGIAMQLSQGRIAGLQAQPVSATPRPTNWTGVRDALAKVGTNQGLLAAEVRGDGTLTPIAEVNADRTQPIGSTFKLYVLGALAQAVSNGDARWKEPLRVVSRYKSLPSGRLQDAPAGRTLPLQEFATRMISESDNTATDHLIARLGHRAIERSMVAMGNANASRNVPLLTTRNLFQLKATAKPSPLLATYAKAGEAERRQILQRLDVDPQPLRVGRNGTTIWSAPRAVDRVEWFASPSDLARAQVYLARQGRQPALAAVSAVLSKNPGVPLDRSKWPHVAFKGGSEPGVVAVSWYLVRADGRAFVLALSASDTKKPVSEDGIVTAAQGAVDILARKQ